LSVDSAVGPAANGRIGGNAGGNILVFILVADAGTVPVVVLVAVAVLVEDGLRLHAFF